MERLKQIGIVFAFLMFGFVVITTYAAFRIAVEEGHWIALLGAILMGSFMVFLIAKVALVPSRRNVGWVRNLITNVNARYLFGFLILVWIANMAFLASMNLDAIKVGGLALIGLFAGIFIFMGFIWAVIGE